MSLYLGCHVSMKSPDYLLGSIEEALSFGCTSCMVFTGPPRNSIRKPVENLKIDQAKKRLEQESWSFDQVVVHAPYIINLANATDEAVFEKSVELLGLELQRTAAIGSPYLVLHPGSHLRQGTESGIRQIIHGLNRILDQDDSNVQIALETMSGKGSEIGGRFEELKEIMEGVHKKERICVCLDTCHIHDAGYNLENWQDVLEEFDKIIGLEHLKVIHVNNSKNEKGSKKDRHENLVYGTISLEALRGIVHDPRLEHAVKVLETPYRDKKPVYAQEIAMLRSKK